MKKLIIKALFLVLTLSIFVSAGLYASEINVTIDDVPVIFDGQGPAIIEGRTLVPVRGVFEELGFDVSWNQASQAVTLTNDDFEVTITVDSNIFSVNDKIHTLEVPAQIVDSRTLLPIRAVLESVGFYVSWEQATGTVAIRSPYIPMPTPSPTPAPTPTPSLVNVSEFELRVFELVNIERANHGIPPLVWSDALADSSRGHSMDMAVTNTFGHTSSDGTTFRERIEKTGLVYFGAAENIAYGSATPEAVVMGLMNSPGHRENILNTNMTHLGVGMYQLPGSQWEFYTTQKFIAAP